MTDQNNFSKKITDAENGQGKETECPFLGIVKIKTKKKTKRKKGVIGQGDIGRLFGGKKNDPAEKNKKSDLKRPLQEITRFLPRRLAR